MQEVKRISFRMDDVGASSKQFEIYGKDFFYVKDKRIKVPSFITNFLFFKEFPLWRGCGPYRELKKEEWSEIIGLLVKYNARLTIAVTACWVEKDGHLIPFHEKFSNEADEIRRGVRDNIIEIANHGLTHCVIGKHLPRLFSSNRKYHREFWDWLPEELHFEHIRVSQKILEDYFGTKVVTFVPPGNVFSEATIHAAQKNGIKIINCNTNTQEVNGLKILSNENIIDFHDKDIVLYGTAWFKKLLAKHKDYVKVWVKDLAKY